MTRAEQRALLALRRAAVVVAEVAEHGSDEVRFAANDTLRWAAYDYAATLPRRTRNRLWAAQVLGKR